MQTKKSTTINSTTIIQNLANRVSNVQQSPLSTSEVVTTTTSDEIRPFNNLREDLECDTVRGVHKELQSLPMAPRQLTI